MPMRALRNEGGFTMATTMLGMFLLSVLALAAVSAAESDLNLTGRDFDQKRAYEAARAGLEDYAFHLSKDNTYWTKCTSVPTPNAVNEQGSTSKRRPVPGSSEQSYALELIPATGSTSCSVANPVGSMLEASGPLAGTFRIRSNGYAGNSSAAIVGTFKRASFLDYMYFTQLETSDPVTYGPPSGDEATVEGANIQCILTWQQGRYNSPIPNSGGRKCSQISFITGDSINGPLHTNDGLAICGEPNFGRTAGDMIEVSATKPGWFSTCGGSNPKFTGNFGTSASVLTPPPTNSQLATLAKPPYSLSGQVHVTLSGNQVTETTSTGTIGPVPVPANGIIYVANESCSSGYSPFGTTYPSSSGCGNVYVHGSYTGQLTIAAANDIIVDGNLINSGEGMLGLIANNFVRVYHPCSGGNNEAGSISDLRIDAAILAINHSFIVDNYNCGDELGILNVNGAIAQKFRGPVGTFGESGTGYKKNYVYDDRLRYIEPPSFIDPVQSSWVIGRETLE